MQLKHILSLAAVQAASAQSLTDVLASQNDTLSTLISLLQQQPELVSTLSSLHDITILAPSNDAFSTLLADPAAASRVQNEAGFVPALLSYHVLNGTFYASDFVGASGPVFAPTLLTDPAYSTVSGGQVVEAQSQDSGVVIHTGYQAEAKVQATDFNFTGGTVHVIDSVLTIPGNLTDVLADANLTALASAATQANLVQAVTDIPQLTLFAPNNEAFEAIRDVAAGLSVEQLAAVLSYHVIEGAVVYSYAVANGTATTVEGTDVTFRVQDDGIFINDARVVEPNLLIKNGVVHVIDRVLIPDKSTATPSSTASSTGGSPAATGTSTVVPGAASHMNTAAIGIAALFAGMVTVFNM